MEIVDRPMVKLNIDEIEVLRKLKQIKVDIDNNSVFNCEEGIYGCRDCPLVMDEECAIGFLIDTITFIDSVTTEE